MAAPRAARALERRIATALRPRKTRRARVFRTDGTWSPYIKKTDTWGVMRRCTSHAAQRISNITANSCANRAPVGRSRLLETLASNVLLFRSEDSRPAGMAQARAAWTSGFIAKTHRGCRMEEVGKVE